MEDAETRRQADVLRGLFYLACPDAPTSALNDAARAVAERSLTEDVSPHVPPEADYLAVRRAASDQPRTLPQAELSGANLSRALLSGADLSGADLTEADLSHALLDGADLSGANLTGTNLSHAFLTGADLSGANLSETNLSHTFLSGADLSGANLTGTDLSHTLLNGANLSGGNLAGTNLFGANLSSATLADAFLGNADVIDVRGLVLMPGTLWNTHTRWSTELSQWALSASDEVSPGTYRVRGHSAPGRGWTTT